MGGDRRDGGGGGQGPGPSRYELPSRSNPPPPHPLELSGSAHACLTVEFYFNGSFPTMYLSYSYNLIATHKILRTPYLGAPLLGG